MASAIYAIDKKSFLIGHPTSKPSVRVTRLYAGVLEQITTRSRQGMELGGKEFASQTKHEERLPHAHYK